MRKRMRRRDAWMLLFLLLWSVCLVPADEITHNTGTAPAPLPSTERPLRLIAYASPERFRYSMEKETLPTISGIEEPITQAYIKKFSEPQELKWIQAALERGAPFMSFIKGKIKEYGVPPEILYLPVIESAFNPAAKSRAGATGLWQFMTNSIGSTLKITNNLDERMDFWKSTEAAMAKLIENYRHFHSWHLALAAYNAGSGGISSVLSKAGSRDYWYLAQNNKLKTETSVYVPKLLAVYYIVSNPKRFGFETTGDVTVDWARVPMNKSVDLEVIADYTGISLAELRQANKELLSTLTPPPSSNSLDGMYRLKVRSEYADAVSALLTRTDIQFIKYYYYTIQAGDTLSELAQHYGVTVNTITANNPGLNANALRLGATVKIPRVKTVGPFTKTRTERKTAAVIDRKTFTGTYTVKSGDSLWSIAQAFHITPESLAAANNMRLDQTLRIGKTLKTPIQ
ncbi:LysM peptidoglycan-binding domain-containing protein [Breznakiellaceae bacterium SP9]